MEKTLMKNELKEQGLTLEEIKKYICPKATDQEAYMFLQLCKAQNLNPFLREAYLIKYGDEKATMVTGKETFTKRADRLSQYDGFKAGVIVQSGEAINYREGSFVIKGEILLGGWAEVFRKDKSHSFRNEVSMTEYARKKRDGTLMQNWQANGGMPATMIRKVAIVQALREAFPDEFGGMYSPEEMPIDSSVMPIYEEGKEVQHPHIEPPKPPIQPPQKKQAPKTSEVAIETMENNELGGMPLPGGDMMPEPELKEPEPDEETITESQLKKIHALMTKHGFKTREQRLKVVNKMLGLNIQTSKELTRVQARALMELLEERDKAL